MHKNYLYTKSFFQRKLHTYEIELLIKLHLFQKCMVKVYNA